MHAVSFNAVQRLSEISIGLNCGAFNASQGISAMDFVLLGGEEGLLFFFIGPRSLDRYHVSRFNDKVDCDLRRSD